MLSKTEKLFGGLREVCPLWLGVAGLSVIAALVAVPIALGLAIAINGYLAPNTALIAILSAFIVSPPFFFALLSTIRRLGASEAHLAEARCEASRRLDELIASQEAAESANRAKSAFLAQMSHELRTPLTAIMGFSEMLMRRDEIGVPLGDVQVGEYSTLIHRSGGMLLSLVNDLLDLAKIEAGKLELSEDLFCVASVLDEARGCVLLHAEARNVDVVVRAPDHSVYLSADRRALCQMLLNLLSNAVKFSPIGGTVFLEVALVANSLVVSVRDEGEGLSAAEQREVVEPFAQLRNSQIVADKGTGLGLPIVKSLIELEGGALEIDSAPGAGTTAALHYPIERVTAVPMRPALIA